MKTCDADTRPTPKTVAEYFGMCKTERKPCGRPAVYDTVMGPRCQEHGEALVDSAMSDSALMGILLQHKGVRPKTREEARKRYLKTIQ
jgi:hypothetical protein